MLELTIEPITNKNNLVRYFKRNVSRFVHIFNLQQLKTLQY